MHIKTILYHDKDTHGGLYTIIVDGEPMGETGTREPLRATDVDLPEDAIDPLVELLTGAHFIPVMLADVFQRGQEASPNESVTVESFETHSFPEYRELIRTHVTTAWD